MLPSGLQVPQASSPITYSRLLIGGSTQGVSEVIVATAHLGRFLHEIGKVWRLSYSVLQYQRVAAVSLQRLRYECFTWPGKNPGRT